MSRDTLIPTVSGHPDSRGSRSGVLVLGGGLGHWSVRLISRNFDYTPAGHQIRMEAGANLVQFDYNAAGRLEEPTRSTDTPASVPFSYDGRSFLRRASDLTTTDTVEPLNDSAGLLHGLLRSRPQPTHRFPTYRISPGGVWKYDPGTGKTTKEEPSNWTKGPKQRCKKEDRRPCEPFEE